MKYGKTISFRLAVDGLVPWFELLASKTIC